MLIQGPFSLPPDQEFCRIYAQFFPFGDPEPLASLVFRGFGARGSGEGGGGGGGVVGFPQFITALSAATRGSTEERLACELRCSKLSDAMLSLFLYHCPSPPYL